MKSCSVAAGLHYVAESMRDCKIVVVQVEDFCYLYFRPHHAKEVISILTRVFTNRDIEKVDTTQTLWVHSIRGSLAVVVPSIQLAMEEI